VIFTFSLDFGLLEVRRNINTMVRFDQQWVVVGAQADGVH
jgi:hypothetical protein